MNNNNNNRFIERLTHSEIPNKAKSCFEIEHFDVHNFTLF